VKPRARLRKVLVLAVWCAWALPPAAAACPACFGEAESPVLDGARLSVIFLGALVYGLGAAGVALVLALRRKVRRQTGASHEDRHGLHLVRPEGTARASVRS
jgi:hypothetical protein